MHDWRTQIEGRLSRLGMEPAKEAAMVEEWVQHLQDRYEELMNAGVPEPEAYRAALAELKESDLNALRPVPVDHSIPAGATAKGNILADIWMDVRFGLRTMRKSPVFTGVVVLTLALGIGANTTIFTVINTLLLNPLPVQSPAELIAVATVDTQKARGSGPHQPLSYLNLEDLRHKNTALMDLAGYTSVLALTLSKSSGSERVFGELVTANYFETLGLRPVAGRFFLPEEDHDPGAHPVAVVAYGAWQNKFGGASDIVGKTLRLNNLVFTVVGVAPQAFKGINAIFGPDLWIPAVMAEQVQPVQLHDALSERSMLEFHGAGRLKPGVTMRQAEANLKTVAAALEKEFPEPNQGRGIAVTPLGDAALGDTRQPVVYGSAVLMLIVGIVLLIACSNVANLLLARAAGRRQEIAARLALGASRSRLVRQLLTESSLLGLMGGALGLFLADQGCKLLWSFRPAEVAANFVDPKLDSRVFVFALMVSLITGLIFGIIPALQASRTDIVEALKEETRTAGRSRRALRFSNVLLVAQVALSLISLITASLFLRSINAAYAINPGFETKRIALVMTNPGQAGYDQARTEQFYRDVRSRVATLPGVVSAAWASNLPFWSRASRAVILEGQQARNKYDGIATIVNTVGRDYFSSTGISMTEGRDFNDNDREGTVPVAIVNETMARRYWPNRNPLGQRFKFTGENILRQVVGVVKTANYTSLNEEPQPCIYLPLKQNFSDAMNLYVRTSLDPSNVVGALQREILSRDPRVDVSDVRTGRKLIEQALFSAKLGVGLLGVFGILALGLASIGLYGIMAYAVNRRKREIGVRMALGAARGVVMGLILRQGIALVGIGIAVGVVASLLIGRALSAMLYGVSGTDPISFLGSSLVLLTVAVAACYLPARRASRVDPLVALRES